MLQQNKHHFFQDAGASSAQSHGHCSKRNTIVLLESLLYPQAALEAMLCVAHALRRFKAMVHRPPT